jgi:xanthine dehydrogenase/oxidase
MHEVEHALDGNLCRCTGYRPILQAFRSFSSEDPAAKEFVQKACDSVFPEELKVAEAASVTLKGDIDRPPRALVLPCFVTPVVALSGSKAVWHRPATLSALLQLKAAHPDMKIIVGNSEVAIERLFRNAQYPVLVTPSHVPELNLIQMSDRPDGRRGLEIGSAATLTVTMEALKEAMATEGEAASRTFVGLYDQMEWFASTPIRNAASIGGNIVTASPISDLNPLFMAAGSILKLMKSSGEQREVPIREFFTGYRRTLMGDDEILLSVWVPCTQELEFFMNYKQCRRRDDDIAIVNAGMRVILTPSPEGAMVVSEASLAFGGMSATSVSAVRTEAMMKGRLWDQDLLKDALAMLSEGGGGQPVAAGAEKPVWRSTARRSRSLFSLSSSFTSARQQERRHRREISQPSAIRAMALIDQLHKVCNTLITQIPPKSKVQQLASHSNTVQGISTSPGRPNTSTTQACQQALSTAILSSVTYQAARFYLWIRVWLSLSQGLCLTSMGKTLRRLGDL